MLLAEVDKSVDEAVLGLEVGKVVEDWQAVRNWRCDLCKRAGVAGRVGDGRGGLRVVAPEHKVVLLVVTRAQVWQGGEFGGERGVDGTDSQVAGIAEVVLFRSNRVCVGGRVRSGRRRQ